MKKLISSLLISLLILTSCKISNATNVANLEFSCNSTFVTIDSQITLYLELNSLSGIEEFYAMTGVLEYDTSVFELESINGENNAKILTGKRILLQFDNPITSGKMMKIVLKAIKKPEGDSTVVRLKNVSVTDNNVEVEQTDITYTINVKDKTPTSDSTSDSTPDSAPDQNLDSILDQTPGSTSGSNSESNSESNSGSTQISQSTQNIIKDNATSKVKLPTAGLNITIAILVILAIVIGTASLLRYKKIKTK